MPKILDIQPTPNNNAMRFILYNNLTNGESYSFENIESAQEDELAKKLFNINGVTNIYYILNYLTVTQDGSRDWNELLREIAPFVRETKEKKIELKEYKTEQNNDPRLQEITNLLSTTVLPYLMMDGGGLDIVKLENNILYIHYQGACNSCTVSGGATLMSIQSIVRKNFPEIVVKVI